MPKFLPALSTYRSARRLTSAITAAAVLAGCTESPAGNLPASEKSVANPNAVGNILIESFSVIEVQYPSAPGRWYYAPLVTMKAPSTSNGGDVLSVAITIPDLGTWECSATRRVAPGSTIELFREVYGDFELTFMHGDGHRIPTAVASIDVLVRENGGTARLNASAGVKEGDFPASYTGGRVDNPWTCGLTG